MGLKARRHWTGDDRSRSDAEERGKPSAEEKLGQCVDRRLSLEVRLWILQPG